MTDHTVTESHDPALSIPGHDSLLVYVHETKSTGLHCDGCPNWYGGRFKGRWAEKQMAEAWARHVADVRSRPTSQEDTVPPYTEADVETVAAALCPQRVDLAVSDARAVLDALATAGWRRTDSPRPVRCPATVGDGPTARPMHPDGECLSRPASEADRD